MKLVRKLLTLVLITVGVIAHASIWDQKMGKKEENAIFAMGCFWCGESEFRDHTTNKLLPGITAIRVGYAGGTMPNPTYENHPGYKEALKITFDPTRISYKKLLEIFWHNVDPFDPAGQFCDQGGPYKAAVFYVTEDQMDEALRTKEAMQKRLKRGQVVTELLPLTTFYDAEEYHQNYKNKSPLKYKYYRWSCGRDQRLKEIWNDE